MGRSHLIRTMEAHGIIPAMVPFDEPDVARVDAFSTSRLPRPVVVLTPDRAKDVISTGSRLHTNWGTSYSTATLLLATTNGSEKPMHSQRSSLLQPPASVRSYHPELTSPFSQHSNAPGEYQSSLFCTDTENSGYSQTPPPAAPTNG